MISIIIPTVKGRERFLDECLASYAAHSHDYELHVIVDRPACGIAWVEGAEKAVGDYIHFSADDLQPLQGWQEAAIQTADMGVLPAPRILNGDGSLQTCGGNDGFIERPTGHITDFTRIPFMRRDQWEQIRDRVEPFLREAHYYTDNAISFAGTEKGIRTAVHRGYAFIHHFAQEKRGAGMSEPDRMRHDYQLFQKLCAS